MSTDSIWARPQPGERRASLTRDQIARAATDLIDAEGTAALSMRRIAQSLGVGTMTLYHYVRTKDELLQLIDDTVMGELLIADGDLPADDWRRALTMIATRSRETFRRHPWTLSALGGVGNGPGPNAMRHFEQSLAAAASTGLEPEACLEIVLFVDDYVFGHSLRDSQEDHSGDDAADALALLQELVAGGDFPHLASLFPPGGSAADVAKRFEAIEQDDARFERGLVRLLDGIALDLERSG
jgi:AcrR family transcriptional regulator